MDQHTFKNKVGVVYYKNTYTPSVKMLSNHINREDIISMEIDKESKKRQKKKKKLLESIKDFVESKPNNKCLTQSKNTPQICCKCGEVSEKCIWCLVCIEFYCPKCIKFMVGSKECVTCSKLKDFN